MSDLPKVMPACSALRDWMVGQSLPLWGEAGWDRSTGLFLERLDRSGAPLPDVPRRLMVQARQIFVFGLAAKRGWSRGAPDRLARCFDAIVRHYHRADGAAGWVFSVDRTGVPVDTRRDFYTLSFVLLALASVAKLTGDPRALALADETLDFLDTWMAHPDGGYIDCLPPPADGQLRQNPHMHLLEALLALHEVAPDGRWLERARRVVSLLVSRFLVGSPPVVAEYFDADWTHRGGPDVPFEPGHHFEWAWLLDRFARFGHRAQTDAAERLSAVAVDIGIGPGRVIYDEVSLGRGVIQRSTRLWPYCEAAKAACVTGWSDPTADDLLATLHERFLAPAHPGSWIDHFGPDGSPKAGDAPASSLYHICCALDVVLGHAQAPAQSEPPHARADAGSPPAG